MLISKEQYKYVATRLAAIRKQVEKELTDLGYEINNQGQINGWSVIIYDEATLRRRDKDGNWRDPDIVLVYIGRQLADHHTRLQSFRLGIKIVHLRESQKGFETERIIKAVVKHLNEQGWRYKEWREKHDHMESVKRACSMINDKLIKDGYGRNDDRVAFSIMRYTDGSAHFNIRLPIATNAEQLKAIADNISHEMIYNEKTAPKPKEPT